MAQPLQHFCQAVPQKGGADVAHMHRFGDIRGAEIHDDGLGLAYLGNPKSWISPKGVDRAPYCGRAHPVVDEACPCYGGLLPSLRGWTVLGESLRKFPRVLAGGLGRHHGKVSLEVAVAFVRTGAHPGFGGKIREVFACPSGNPLLQFDPQGH